MHNQNKERSYGDKSKTWRKQANCDRICPVFSSEQHPSFLKTLARQNVHSFIGTSFKSSKKALWKIKVERTNLEWVTKPLARNLGHLVMRRHQGMDHIVIKNAEVY